MSKSKEQCLNIISQHFIESNEDITLENRVLALEKSIKAISGSEYSLIWTYNPKTNILKTTDIEVPLSDSILKTVLLSKKVFFDNHIQSHKEYDKNLDNPLRINLKSMLIAPVLDKTEENVIGFITAFCSMKNGHEFQRYDTRSITLLNKHSRDVVELLLENNFNIVIENKEKINIEEKIDNKTITPKKIENSPKNIILENRYKKQEKKIIDLEKLLISKDNEIKRINEEKNNEIFLKKNYINKTTPTQNIDELKSILSFLTNEVTYLSNDSHALYTFLEVIKNSLYDKEQLNFIDRELKKSQLLHNFSDSLYNSDRMPLINKKFQSFQSFCSVTNLYSSAFSQENILFNVFIDPKLPIHMIADIEKIKSVIVHLLNNVKYLITTNGIAEVLINYKEKESALELIIKGIQPEIKKNIYNLFKSNITSNSLVCNSSGLGLSVSSKLVTILGSKLKLTTENKNEHFFRTLIPIETVKILKNKKDFYSNQLLKIGILLNEENTYAYTNLKRYLEAFSINSKDIFPVDNYKKLHKLKISHFICFENMLTNKLELNKFSSVTILKHSDTLLSKNLKNNIKVNELYINSYYGMALQKILFPHIGIEDLTENMFLVEDTFFSKITNKVKG